MNSREGAVVDCAVAPWYLQGIALPFDVSRTHFQFSKSMVIWLWSNTGCFPLCFTVLDLFIWRVLTPEPQVLQYNKTNRRKLTNGPFSQVSPPLFTLYLLLSPHLHAVVPLPEYLLNGECSITKVFFLFVLPISYLSISSSFRKNDLLNHIVTPLGSAQTTSVTKHLPTGVTNLSPSPKSTSCSEIRPHTHLLNLPQSLFLFARVTLFSPPAWQRSSSMCPSLDFLGKKVDSKVDYNSTTFLLFT